MQKFKINLSTIQDVKKFVNIVNKFDTELDLVSGKYTVDGKSIMGIFSLDLLKPIELVVHSDNAADLLAEIEPFRVKEK